MKALKVPMVASVASSTIESKPEIIVTHRETPDAVKAIYMTSWVASTPSIRERLIRIVDTTEINSIVIDVKDDTGRIAYESDNVLIKSYGSYDGRIKDLKKFIAVLHDKNIYVIGRIAVFQDSFLPTVKPELALHNTKTGLIWKDRKSQLWLNQLNPIVWEYVATVAKDAYAQGFDEINFDYIRFPSDGNISEIDYGMASTTVLNKPQELNKFFAYLRKEVGDEGIPISADLFGQITSEKDDMGIGQTIAGAAKYFDYIAPMIYPSHYYSGYMGLSKPVDHPYEVVKYALLQGSMKLTNASSSPSKLRPWLQDFSLGTTYTPAMVKTQIKATYDSGLTSWMLWDPSNKYSESALEKE
ncbi:MAG: putative glycoside hydrolase [Candidatus Vogelbacteria bacterium]|nr:putative glycoside hydrolase [Candidatus Vogelbacteria bacterium]